VIRPIGYVAADIGGMSPQALVGTLAQLGYDAVDWTMEQYDPLADPPGELERLVAVAHGAGLGVPQLMVHQDYVSPDPAVWEERVRLTERAIDAAAVAGIPSVGVVTGPNRWTDCWAVPGEAIDVDDAWALAVAALERILAHASGTGVLVALEPCWGTLAWNRSSTQQLLADVGREDLHISIDPSHFAVSGDDVSALARDWADRLVHVHLKDAFGRPGAEGEDFCFLLPGEGATAWLPFFDALDAVGYGGAMSVEFESFRLREQALGGSVEEGARLALGLVNGLLETWAVSA
jgi:sugar phosphate isomerase/epimerase